MQIVEFPYILKFIRHFGNQFEILYFHVLNERKCHVASRYLNDYCINLRTIFFRSFHCEFDSFFSKAFHVQNLFFEFTILKLKPEQLTAFFPCLKTLSLYQVKTGELFHSVNDYQDLKYFIIDKSYTFANAHLCSIKFVNNWKEYCIERNKFL